jgi:hypothetical protein
VLLTGADHRDAPALQFNPAADINDVYAFVNGNNGKVVLAMTVNPFTVPGLNPVFSTETLYQFKIDQDGDAVEDLVIQVLFDAPTGKAANASQTFTVLGPEKPKKTGVLNSIVKTDKVIKGAIDNAGTVPIVADSQGIKVFAGARDDPFFFDFVYVINILNGVANTRNPGIDFFAGVNVSVIAIELPPEMLKGSSNTIHVWGTTNLLSSAKRSVKAKKGEMPSFETTGAKTYVQFDRMGLPAINTVLISSEHKNAFNVTPPSLDATLFRTDVVDHIKALNGQDQLNADTTASIVLPDVLTLDVGKTSGFLNGRRPEDDVIDAELNLLTKGGLTSDGVNANDVPFLQDFPFFAPPHQAKEGVPIRN